ncbi:MAG: MotE family protein [Oceanicaulis sp.]
MSARPLLLLAVLLGGLLGLKALSLADGASLFLAERAMAATGAPDAQADESEEAAAEAGDAASETDTAEPEPDSPPARRRERIPTASELSLETDLARRRQELARRAEALDTREQLLEIAETRYNDRLAELHRLRDDIQGLLNELDAQRESEISAIVNTYGQLEPDAAAGILQAMGDSDPGTLLLVAGQLQETNPRRFAAVLSEMEPGFAASLTSRLRARAAPEPGTAETEARNAAAGEG